MTITMVREIENRKQLLFWNIRKEGVGKPDSTGSLSSTRLGKGWFLWQNVRRSD